MKWSGTNITSLFNEKTSSSWIQWVNISIGKGAIAFSWACWSCWQSTIPKPFVIGEQGVLQGIPLATTIFCTHGLTENSPFVSIRRVVACLMTNTMAMQHLSPHTASVHSILVRKWSIRWVSRSTNTSTAMSEIWLRSSCGTAASFARPIFCWIPTKFINMRTLDTRWASGSTHNSS